ncbi:SDR family NAD(P)-dependent oxidoreductase [Nocardia sp. NPDC058176]|uniref:SDR family NAD(P)-dependent oxidoreductase n=1 Tax=Nocardia sp. NPDC058176 TaxID=3346368 RepID=UPI0036D7621A
MSDHRLPDGTIPVLLSSDTEDSLRREAVAILAYCERHPDLTPEPVAEMLLRTRVARKHRALATVTDRAELLAALHAIAEGTAHSRVVRGTAIPRTIGYVYPGQGSQRPGMGRMFYQHSAAFRAAVDECEAVFADLFGISPLAYLLHEGDELEDDVRIVQPALFMQMIGLSALWRAVGVHPAATVGHSQGEIAAAVVSGVMPLADGVRVVTIRAELVETTCRDIGVYGEYSMAVLGIDRDECEALLAANSGWAELSVVNSAHILAISGQRSMITEVVETLTTRGAFAREIRVDYPAHTSIVSPFRDLLCESLDVLDSPTFAATEIPCYGGALGKAITPDLPTGDYWFWNLRNRVRFDLAIAAAAEYGVDTLLEIADHPILMLAIQENLATLAPPRDYLVTGTSRRTATDLTEFARSVAQIAVSDTNFDWDGLLVPGPAVKRLPLFDFPNTQTNDKHLWAPFDYTGTSALPVPDAPIVEPVPRIVEQWVHLPRRTLVPPRSIALVDPTDSQADLLDAIRAGAKRHGATIVDLDGGNNSATTVYDTIAVLLPALPTANVEAVGDSLPLSAPGSINAAIAQLAEFLGQRSWLPDTAGVTDIWLVTTGGEQVVDGDLPGLFPAAAQAGFRCLAAEYPGISFRHLDLPAAAAHPPITTETFVGASATTTGPTNAVTAAPGAFAGTTDPAAASAASGAYTATVDPAMAAPGGSAATAYPVTTAGTAFGASTAITDPVAAASAALGASAAIADPAAGASAALGASATVADPATTAKAVLGAMHTAGEPELAVRESGLFGKRLIADESVVTTLTADELREVVIVGGTGKLGLDFCAEFARAGAGRITLVSRSGGSADAQARIAEITAAGARVRVLTCDVTDPDAVRALGEQFADTPVDLLVHAAVDYAAAADPTPASITAAAAPKIVALDHLIRELPRTTNGRVLLCSSLSATVGGRGHAVYAAVNRMLDAAAARYRAEGIACTSVQWGLWRAVGADQAEALAAITGTGLRPMDPAGAIAAGVTTAAENVIVVAADWPRVTEVFTAFGLGALFADLKITETVAAEPVTSAAVAISERQLDPAAPIGATPVGPIANAAPVAPIGTANLGASIGRANPVAPIGTANPGPSIGTANSVAPVGTANPGPSIGTANSVAPIGTANPVAPIGTANPLAPIATADLVRLALREVMGLDETDPIDGTVPLVALGLDSLQALDLRKRVETELRLELPVTAIMGGASLDEVIGLLQT